MKSDYQLKYAPLESDRFKRNIYRLEISDESLVGLDVNLITEEIYKKNFDCCIIRIPYHYLENVNELLRLPYETILGDVLVYYNCKFTKHKPNELRNRNLKFVPFSFEISEDLESLSKKIFKAYKNHYCLNPSFEVDIVKIYSDWLKRFIPSQKDNTKMGWTVRLDQKIIGVATCNFSETKSEGVLYGVVPEAAGGGVYGDIIRFTQDYSIKRGKSEMEVSTQVGNYAVQKVWRREGFYMKKAFFTIHINKKKV